MIRTLILSAVVATASLAGLTLTGATADAHPPADFYHHRFEVLVECGHRWENRGTFGTHFEAERAARPFRHEGLRRNEPGHCMSTFEAVAQALRILEGRAVAEALMDFYRWATDRMLLVRGKLKAGDVYGGLDDQIRGQPRSLPAGGRGHPDSAPTFPQHFVAEGCQKPPGNA